MRSLMLALALLAFTLPLVAQDTAQTACSADTQWLVVTVVGSEAWGTEITDDFAAAVKDWAVGVQVIDRLIV